MKKILFLPFLQIASGHQQVADALGDYIKLFTPNVQLSKVDILHYTFGNVESFISGLYLKSIKYLPSFYSKLYKGNALKSSIGMKRYPFYEALFYTSLKKLIKDERPDLIICTHCLPSYLLNRMKRNGILTTPVINAYTDYFINTVWGIDQIDLHFVPSVKIKDELIHHNIDKNKILVTGIPVYQNITKKRKVYEQKGNYKVLISGGNLGVGAIEKLFYSYKPNNRLQYYVLCGKNKKLFEKLSNLKFLNVTPLKYISCRNKMNGLYEDVDVVITKPGGVTISECLLKGLPIILLKALPGQEEMNEKFLVENNLVLKYYSDTSLREIELDILNFLENENSHRNQLEHVYSHQDSLVEFAEILPPLLFK